MSLPAEQGEGMPLVELMRQVHAMHREAIADFEAAQQRLKTAKESCQKSAESLRRTLQVGKAAREERLRQNQRQVAAAAAAAEAALDQRASQDATSCTLAGAWLCRQAGGTQGSGCVRGHSAV